MGWVAGCTMPEPQSLRQAERPECDCWRSVIGCARASFPAALEDRWEHGIFHGNMGPRYILRSAEIVPAAASRSITVINALARGLCHPGPI
jgi:hypothetical protein